MEERRKFEKYQDFLNKRKFKPNKENINNNIKLENQTEPCTKLTGNKSSKNVIQSCIESIKEQMISKNKNNAEISNTSIHNKIKRNKKDNSKTKSKILNKMNSTNNNYYNKMNTRVNNYISERPLYSEKIFNSDIYKNKSESKIRDYSNNHYSHNNLRYNFSSDYSPYNKELDHIVSSYDFKTDNKGDLNPSTKIHFRNLLSTVNELKAKNDLLKKELRNKDKIISLLEKKCLNKNKKGTKDDKNMNDILMNEYNDDILIDNQKLKSEILNLNKELENQKIYYEDVIKDYKNQLNYEKNKNNVFQGNYKEMENRFKTSNDRVISMEDDLEEAIIKKSKLEEVNRQYEIINANQQRRIENLENQLNVVLSLVKDLFNKENELFYPMRTKLFYEISNLNNLYQ